MNPIAWEIISGAQEGVCYSDFSSSTNAARLGHLSLLKRMEREGDLQHFSSTMLSLASSSGNLDLVRWLHAEKKVEILPDAMDLASERGSLAICQYLALAGATCTLNAMDNAARNGHLIIVRWLQQNRPVGCSHFAMDGAATNGHIDVLNFLESHGKPCTLAAYKGAGSNGNTQVLSWLLTNKPISGGAAIALKAGARHGHLNVVKAMIFMLSGEERSVRLAMINASSRGHKHIVSWLNENVINFHAGAPVRRQLRRVRSLSLSLQA
jgi:hypothetical protein